MPSVSVIVPVYKAEAYLQGCIDSIFAQTFTDWELLLVDDGSPDGCPAICDAAALRDSRVHVWHGPNKGVAAARNRGLAMASGDYVSFVDSDDRLAPDAIEKLRSKAEEEKAQVVWCDYAEFRDGTGDVWPCTAFSEGTDRMGTLFSLLAYGLQSSPPWNWLLIKRQLIETQHIRFPETYQIGEDFCFGLQVHALAGKSAKVPETLYFYNQGNAASLTHTEAKETTPEDLRFMDDCRNFLEGLHIWPFVEKAFGWRMLLYKSRWVTRAADFNYYYEWQPDVNRFAVDDPLLSRNVKRLMQMLDAGMTFPAAVLASLWRFKRNLLRCFSKLRSGC